MVICWYDLVIVQLRVVVSVVVVVVVVVVVWDSWHLSGGGNIDAI